MANKKIPNKTKRVAIEITLILIFVAIIVMSFLSDFSVIPIPSFASLNLSGIEELFVSLFTVQASVATVSIAIVSIITGLVSESILGISVSGFITNRKPVVLKHNRLIIANLIVTALNYVSVAMAFFNVCIALFIISIVITILLVDEVYIIFLGKNRIRKEIHEFVFENYDAEILNDLNNELLSAIEIGNSLTITEDFEIIKKIFKAEAIKSNYKSNEIIEQLSKMVCDAFEKTSYKHNGQRINYCLLQICEIYKIANENEDAPLHLNVWNKIVRDIFRALKDIDFDISELNLTENAKIYYTEDVDLHTDKEKIKMARTFNANQVQVLTKIVIPSNIPTFFNSLKVNIGLSLVGVISGEFLVSKGGLGYLIVYGGQVFQLDLVMTSVIILAVVAALMYESIVLLEKKFVK